MRRAALDKDLSHGEGLMPLRSFVICVCSLVIAISAAAAAASIAAHQVRSAPVAAAVVAAIGMFGTTFVSVAAGLARLLSD